MGDRLEVRKDVGVLVMNGNATIHGPLSESPPPVYMEEQEFFKWTGIDASAPARVALNRLLKTQDVTSKSLRRVWKTELIFIDDPAEPRLAVSVFRFVPVIAFGLYGCLLACTLALVISVGRLEVSAFAFLTLVWLGLLAMSVWITATEMRSYYISKRIHPMVERVNRELPEIMEQWRA